MTVKNNQNGAAQQRTTEEITALAQRLIEEEVKEPELPQTVELAGEAAMSAPSVDVLPRVIQQPIEAVQQPADANQVNL